jgi:hypothetical protein
MNVQDYGCLPRYCLTDARWLAALKTASLWEASRISGADVFDEGILVQRIARARRRRTSHVAPDHERSRVYRVVARQLPWRQRPGQQSVQHLASLGVPLPQGS